MTEVTETITAKTPWKDYMGDVPMRLDGVSADQHPVLYVQHLNAAGRVPGQMEDLEHPAAQIQRIAAESRKVVFFVISDICVSIL